MIFGSSCASSTTPFGSKAKKRRMNRGKSFNQVPGGIEWPDVVDIKILDLLVMAHNENGDFSGLNSSCAAYWQHLVHHLNDYIKSHFPEVPEKTISDVQGRCKALRTSYRVKFFSVSLAM
ncbi:hypothetical protein LIER_42061 [Lithospermum erythrorhizon]|uniref:Uncharacterized protein n=1 Tax=Lithospermum erythrorhizon TaxID=34254 RepID=A0AAV3RMG0_LITER